MLSSCLNTAIRKRLLKVNPLAHAEQVPPVDDEEHGTVLDETELRKLVNGFKGSVMFPIVAVAAFTGARGNKILALRWADLDGAGKKLRIERSIKKVKKTPLGLKGPKRDVV